MDVRRRLHQYHFHSLPSTGTAQHWLLASQSQHNKEMTLWNMPQVKQIKMKMIALLLHVLFSFCLSVCLSVCLSF